MALHHSPKMVTDGLILSLDAANPKSYPGSGTLWKDLSGNGHHATFTTLATHVPGSHFSFDGVGDFATVDSGLETVIDGLSELTITGLVNYHFFEHVDNIIGWGNANASDSPFQQRTLGFYNHSGILRPSYATSASFGTSATMVDKWVFLVSRYTATTIYADMFGNESISNSHTIAFPGATWKDISGASYDITIGKTSYFARFAECDISLLQAYNRKLTDEEIIQNYTACRGRFGI